MGQRNNISFKIPWKPVPDYNDKKGKVVIINPFVVKDVLVVNLTSPSRLNLTAPSYTPNYVISSEEVNHQGKEVKRLDDKEDEVRVTPGGARSLF